MIILKLFVIGLVFGFGFWFAFFIVKTWDYILDEITFSLTEYIRRKIKEMRNRKND